MAGTAEPGRGLFQQRRPGTHAASAATTVELIYHATVRDLRKSHGNAILGLAMSVLQALVFVAMFLVMYAVLGLRSSPIRGDFMLFVMSGVFLYMTHIKAIAAVAGSEGPASAMMQHAPMTTAVAITSGALAALYNQTLAAAVILFAYHIGWEHITIEDPVGVLGMHLLAWFSGCAVGMVFLAAKPWVPGVVGIARTVFTRANMIFSGKMVAANSTPYYILAFFTWNPLYHIIDQCRGYVFINYVPHRSSVEYPVWVSIALLTIGLMGEFVTRKHASKSWSARR